MTNADGNEKLALTAIYHDRTTWNSRNRLFCSINLECLVKSIAWMQHGLIQKKTDRPSFWMRFSACDWTDPFLKKKKAKKWIVCNNVKCRIWSETADTLSNCKSQLTSEEGFSMYLLRLREINLLWSFTWKLDH